eukprot:363272-Chlamydomonas_euryale.AAC.1
MSAGADSSSCRAWSWRKQSSTAVTGFRCVGVDSKTSEVRTACPARLGISTQPAWHLAWEGRLRNITKQGVPSVQPGVAPQLDGCGK